MISVLKFANNMLQIDEGFSDEDLEANLQRDKHARLTNSVNQLIDQLTPSAPDTQLRNACDQLVSPVLLYSSSEHTPEHFMIAQYYDRITGNAGADGLLAWDARHFGSTRGAMLQRGVYETASDNQPGMTTSFPVILLGFDCISKLVTEELGFLESFCLIGYVCTSII